MVGGPISRLRLLAVDIVILLLQLIMLAIGVSTTTPPSRSMPNVARVAVSSDLDRAERGETEDGSGDSGGDSGGGGGGMGRGQDSGFEHVIVSVGVVETIKSLWDNEEPIVRRFR